MIPVNEPLLDGNEQKYVTDCLATGWVSSEGDYVRRFEEQWAKYCDMPHGIAVSSGTAALYAAVAALELPPGSEIIVPSFTIISCVQAILAADCVPVLVDCDKDTWCMDPLRVAESITRKTRAIMVVHIYGHPVEMGTIMNLASEHKLYVIEDAAEAHGAIYDGRRAHGEIYDGRRVGGFGDVSCFSFYANKILTTGEGGMVLAKSDRLATRLRNIRNLFFETGRRFRHSELGNNYRMTNVQAAIGLAQVERIEEKLEKKRHIGKKYTSLLNKLPLQLPVERRWALNVYWMYGVVLHDSVPFDADEFAKRLRNLGVDTRPFFLGMHEQPAFRGNNWPTCLGLDPYPVTKRISRRGLYLPSGLAMTDQQIEQVATTVKQVLGY